MLSNRTVRFHKLGQLMLYTQTTKPLYISGSRLKLLNLRHMSSSKDTEPKIRPDKKTDNNNFNPRKEETDTYSNYFRRRYEEYGKDVKQLSTDFGFMLDQFEKKNYNMNKIKYFGFAGAILVVFMFWRTIKSFLSRETSDVAIRAMDDKDVRKKVFESLLKILDDARNDPEVSIMLADLLNKALVIVVNDERTSKLLHDEKFVGILTSVASTVTSEVIKSEQVKKDVDDLVTQQIQKQLTDKENKELLAEVFYRAARGALSKFKPW